jgi:hypothetical protein
MPGANRRRAERLGRRQRHGILDEYLIKLGLVTPMRVRPAASAATAPNAKISRASRPVRSNMMTTPMATIAQTRM